MVETPEPGTARTLPVLCPECQVPFPEPRALSLHIERHREVRPEVKDPRTGKVNSTPCPQGCGRHFIRPSEYGEHVPLCDGSVPLYKPSVAGQSAPVVEEPMRKPRKQRKERKPMVKCEKCGAPFKDGRGLYQHRRGGCGTKGGKAKGKARRDPAGGLGSTLGDIVRKKVEEEREKAREHEAKADALEEMASKLDTLID